MPRPASPPIPTKLFELLKDYPEQIARLQKVLDTFANHAAPRPQPFDEAIWSLEDELADLVTRAHDERQAAEVSGDATAIERAREKERTMLRTRSKVRWLDHDGFWKYFQENKEASE